MKIHYLTKSTSANTEDKIWNSMKSDSIKQKIRDIAKKWHYEVSEIIDKNGNLTFTVRPDNQAFIAMAFDLREIGCQKAGQSSFILNISKIPSTP